MYRHVGIAELQKQGRNDSDQYTTPSPCITLSLIMWVLQIIIIIASLGDKGIIYHCKCLLLTYECAAMQLACSVHEG